jgi:hypothetical protein
MRFRKGTKRIKARQREYPAFHNTWEQRKTKGMTRRIESAGK